MSDLAFLAIALTAMLAVSAVLALMIWDPEQDTFIQMLSGAFWLIVHVVALVALAIVYTAALLWGIGVI
mgnify:CR=1 FL=1